ncbi:MAG TPA: hypothetical protein VMR51_00645 [Patescibacteria group bacterium]|nr:hypothetical protein [Patescibacteria group bacterium]
MINLLPDQIKKEIIYGRRNRVLLHWIMSVIIVIAGVGGMTVFGELFINKNVHTLQSVAKLTQARISDQNLTSTQTDIQNLSNNFKTVTQLLSKQLLFSKLFVKIGGIIPNGAILSGITLSNTDSVLDINIASTTRDTATQAFVNIGDPANGLFEKADLVSVSCAQSNSSNSGTIGKYPCVTVIKVVIKTDSSFYFLNSITGGAKN